MCSTLFFYSFRRSCVACNQRSFAETKCTKYSIARKLLVSVRWMYVNGIKAIYCYIHFTSLVLGYRLPCMQKNRIDNFWFYFRHWCASKCKWVLCTLFALQLCWVFFAKICEMEALCSFIRSRRETVTMKMFMLWSFSPSILK